MDKTTLFHAQHHQQENLTQDWVQRHSSRTRDDVNDETHRGLASRLYALCLVLLRRIFLQQKSSKEGSNALREELGKFYLWGHEFGEGKLDQALEYSEDIKIEVLDSLRSVGRSLLQAYSSPNAIIESNLPKDNREELSGLVDQAQAVTSSRGLDPSHGDVGENIGSDTEDEDEIESSYDGLLVRKLAQQTSWLSQLSTAIEQEYIRAKVRQKEADYPRVVPFSVSGPAQFYVSLVQDKFPKAGRKLVERFGEADWQRHVNIRNQLDSDIPAAEEPAAHSVFRPHSAFHDSGIGTSVPAHTSYAASHASFRSSASESARGSIGVPLTPAEVDAGDPFQCFLCKMMLSNINNRIDWKMHVFSDLQPYLCTFPDCPNELAQFPSRAAWAEHEFSQHRTMRCWKCPECHEKYASESEWEDHVCMQHDFKLVGKELQVAKNMALVIEEAMRVDGEECPLCHVTLNEARRGYVKHVGRHMEEIALITLPRDTEENKVSTSGSASGSSDRGSMQKEFADLEKFGKSFILTSSPMGAFEKIPKAAGIGNTENSAVGVTRLEDPFAKSPLPSEGIREQKSILRDGIGWSPVPKKGEESWESVNYDHLGPLDRVSRRQTSQREHPLLEAKEPSSESSFVNPYNFPPPEGETKARRRGPFLLNGSLDEDGNNLEERIAHSRSFNKGQSSIRVGAFPNMSLPAATEQVGSTGMDAYSNMSLPAATEQVNLHRCLAGGACTFSTDRHTDLKRHYKAKHPGPRDETFQCSYKSCTKEFKRKDHLQDHCKRVHYRDLPAEYGGTGSRLR